MRIFLSLVKSTQPNKTTHIIQPPPFDEYYLFAEHGRQEDAQSWLIGALNGTIKNLNSVRTVRHRQTDGSIFKTYTPIRGSEKGFWSMFRTLQDLAPRDTRLIPEKILRNENEDRAFLSNNRLPNHFEYYLFLTHHFENGSRFFPIVYDRSEGLCYNVSRMFPKLVPEDNLGVLVADYKNAIGILNLPALRPGKLIEFFAHIRLCPTCLGVVNDKVKKTAPWNRLRITSDRIIKKQSDASD